MFHIFCYAFLINASKSYFSFSTFVIITPVWYTPSYCEDALKDRVSHTLSRMLISTNHYFGLSVIAQPPKSYDQSYMDDSTGNHPKHFTPISWKHTVPLLWKVKDYKANRLEWITTSNFSHSRSWNSKLTHPTLLKDFTGYRCAVCWQTAEIRFWICPGVFFCLFPREPHRFLQKSDSAAAPRAEQLT